LHENNQLGSQKEPPMSRAFVNEDQLAQHAALPERELSPHPNYVTPRGLALLKQRLSELEAERSTLLRRHEINAREHLAAVERDLRYYAARVESAKLVPFPAEPPAQVTFGCRVVVVTPADEELSYTLVGEDEAEVARGLISWVSPLGRALLGARAGDTVVWQRPAGDLELEIIEIAAAPQSG
jgi:transcription elongation GreA/GreB family factor